MTIDAHDSRLLPVVGGLVAFAWYAMPDLIRSRGLRAALKTGLLAVTGAGTALVAREHAEQLNEIKDEISEVDHAPLIVAGAVVLTAGLTVAGERFIYRLGERRRARGRRLAHTVPALVLAGLTAASVLPELDHAGHDHAGHDHRH